MLDNLMPGQLLKEADIADILRAGEQNSRFMLELRRRSFQRRTSYADFIESTALGTGTFDEAKPQNRTLRCDPLFETMERAEALREEEEQYLRYEAVSMRFAEDLVLTVWEAFALLKKTDQVLLESYYIEGKTAAEAAEIAGVSESTFWRKRKKALTHILEYCGKSIFGCRYGL